MCDITDNERWYLALTALWAWRIRRGRDGVHRPAVPDVRFAAEVLGLRPGARVLDMACAWGRTTLELARQGFRPIGFDLSPELLAIARERAAAEGIAIPFVRGTVRRLPDLGRFDAVTALYDDSVLSFEDEADNLAALCGVARLLRPGGRFLFGTTDCALIIPPFQRAEREEAVQRIVEEIAFDTARRIGVSVRVHSHPDGRTRTFHRVRRHYAVAEVGSLLAQAGLRLERAWCGYDHALPYGSRDEGMVVLCMKTGR